MVCAILTITRNSSHIWKNFIDSYKKHCDRERYDLYLYDNGSREGDVEYLETYVREQTIRAAMYGDKNLLFTKAANNLLKWTNGEIVEFDGKSGAKRALKPMQEMDSTTPIYDQFLLVNPDIEFKEGWDRDLDKNQGIMGFVLVKPDGEIEHAGGYGGGDHEGRGEMDSPEKFTELREVDWVTFGAVAINRKVIDKVGLMDEENYPHFSSDREYCRRCREFGYAITCSPARLIHAYGYSTRPYIWREVPAKIWDKMVEERRQSGVYFPARQEDFKHT